MIVLAGVPLAVIGNVARICFTVAVAEVLGQNAGKTVEQNFGLVTFAVAIGLLLALGHWLREPESTSAGAGPRGDSGDELKAAAWPVADQALK